MTDQPPSFQFSIFRLALALGVFGIPFAFLTSKGTSGIVLAALIGGIFALLAIVTRRRDQERILTVLLGAAIGAVISTLIIPPADAMRFQRPGIETHGLERLLVGAVAGCFIGLAVNWLPRSD